MKRLITLLILIYSISAVAQSDSIVEKKTKPTFKLSLNYNTGLNYYGRTDSLKSTGVFPLIELWINDGLYINAAPIFVNNKSKSFDYAGTVASIGYQFNKSKKWMANIYLLKPFYKESSELVQSALQAQSGTSISLLNKYLNLNVGGDIKYSDKLDYGANIGVDHLIRIENKDTSVFVIDPSIYVYAGTQNFTKTYYKKTNASLLMPATQQMVTKKVQTFNVLAYELSVPFVYAKKHWQLIATPAYVLPQNLVTIPGHSEQSERGENMFYGTVAVKYSF
ncbi:MAG: hypothetical protein C4330_13055 [Chitinophagaceae bacterium]